MCGDHRIAKMYCENNIIYSSGNIVTYIANSGITYQEEVEYGESCLEPKTFTPERENYTFAGWSTEPDGTVVDSMVMGDDPITLYAVWTITPVTVGQNTGWSSGAFVGLKTFYLINTTANLTNYKQLRVILNIGISGLYRGGHDEAKITIGNSSYYLFGPNMWEPSYTINKTFDISALSGNATVSVYVQSNGASEVYKTTVSGSVSITLS